MHTVVRTKTMYVVVQDTNEGEYYLEKYPAITFSPFIEEAYQFLSKDKAKEALKICCNWADEVEPAELKDLSIYNHRIVEVQEDILSP